MTARTDSPRLSAAEIEGMLDKWENGTALEQAAFLNHAPILARQCLDLMEAQRWVPIGEIDESWKDGRELDVIYWYISVKVLNGGGSTYPSKRQTKCYYKNGKIYYDGKPITWWGTPTHVMLPIASPESPST